LDGAELHLGEGVVVVLYRWDNTDRFCYYIWCREVSEFQFKCKQRLILERTYID